MLAPSPTTRMTGIADRSTVMVHEPRIEILGPDAISAVLELWLEAGLRVRSQGRDSSDGLAAQLEQTPAFLLGVYEGRRLVGAAMGTDDGRKGWINRIAVLPGHRRAGIGRALIRACEAIFEEREIGIVACLVEAENAAGLRLFADLGFEIHRDIAYLRKPVAGEDW